MDAERTGEREKYDSPKCGYGQMKRADAGGGASSVRHRRTFVLEGRNGSEDVEECGQKRREGQ